MLPKTKPGSYHLQFLVYDKFHEQSNVAANVSVTLLYMSENEVKSSASVRIVGVTDEEFIRIYDYKVILK